MKLKSLLFVTLIAATPFVNAAGAASAPVTAPAPTTAATSVTGEVLEVKDVEVYTYLRLKTNQGEVWAAVNKTAVKKGSTVTLENVSVMENFESKVLKKTFPRILFANLAGAGTAATDPHAGMSKAADTSPVKVAKASGANAYTVAEIIAKSAQLKDKPVRLSGKVVKYNAGIMGKNWLHLQDGSGKAADNSHDILVTSSAEAKPGEVLTVTGTVRTDKDFGAGYSYKVLIEEATLQR